MVDHIRKKAPTAPPVTSQPKADRMHPKKGNKILQSSLNHSKKWIDTGIQNALKVFQDKCWCQAIMMGVASFAMDRFNIFQTLVVPGALITAFAKTEVDINGAEWAQGSDLLELKAEEQKRGHPISGMLKNKCSERCIRLNPILRTSKGDQPAFPGSNTKVTYRDITIAHEALHKLFQELEIVEKLLSSNKNPENEAEEKALEEKKWEKEEDLVRFVTLLYNDLTEYTSALEQSTPATKHLFSACPRLDVCDRGHKAQPGGQAMAPHSVRPEKIAKVPSSPVVDFNNDGFLDLVTRSSFACLHDTLSSTGQTAYLKSDPAYAHKSLLMPLSQCEPPIRQKDVKAWQFPGNRPGMWSLPYTRFFNSNHSMFFRAGQTVALRSDPKAREVIQSPVFLYNYKTDKQLSPVFVMFSGCRFVSIDDLVWVTPANDTLDMKRIFSLAKTPDLTLVGISKSTEVEVLKWVSGAFAMAEAWPPQMKGEAKRDAVVSYVAASPMMQLLPNGWESSLLFTMNLPQLRLPPPPQPKDTFTCNRPPYAQSQ